MTDDKRFLDGVGHAWPRAMSMHRLIELAALPMRTCVVEMLIAASDARVELERKEAAPLAWIVPAIDSAVGRIGKLLQRLAS